MAPALAVDDWSEDDEVVVLLVPDEVGGLVPEGGAVAVPDDVEDGKEKEPTLRGVTPNDCRVAGGCVEKRACAL